jgi:hypothetical protein
MASCEDIQHKEIKNLTAELGAGGPRQRFRYHLDCSIGVAFEVYGAELCQTR